MKSKLGQRMALILGGTAGLGKQISLIHQAHGHMAYEIGSSVVSSNDTNSSIQLHCDLKNPKDVKDFIHHLRNWDGIDYFYWVAGRLFPGELHTQSAEDIESIIDINFRNSVLFATGVWKKMRQDSKTSSAFTVVASSSGRKPRPKEVIYAATKHAQVGFTESLGQENDAPNIRVTLVTPGGMKTEAWKGFEPSDYETFLDPAAVAAKIVESVMAQTKGYDWLDIPRGSL